MIVKSHTGEITAAKEHLKEDLHFKLEQCCRYILIQA